MNINTNERNKRLLNIRPCWLLLGLSYTILWIHSHFLTLPSTLIGQKGRRHVVSVLTMQCRQKVKLCSSSSVLCLPEQFDETRIDWANHDWGQEPADWRSLETWNMHCVSWEGAAPNREQTWEMALRQQNLFQGRERGHGDSWTRAKAHLWMWRARWPRGRSAWVREIFCWTKVIT